MAVYKVPQDVEADDKLIGPFSFKQFVFIIIMIGFLYLSYVMFTISPLFVILPLPVAIFFGILGLWPRKDQPVEVYLGALIRFWTKPHIRIWSQEGQARTVEITAPVVEVHKYTDDLSQTEVRSRLSMLAQTMDTKGWATKNLEVQDVATMPSYNIQQSDRLVMPQVVTPQTNDVMDIHQSDDMLDVQNNSVAQNFDALSQKAAESARAAAISNMQQAVSAPQTDEPKADVKYNPYPDMKQSVVGGATDDSASSQQNVAQIDQPDEEPAQAQPAQTQASSTDENQSTNTIENPPSTAILNLANNSDLSISTIAKQAEQAERALQDDETIELH